MSESVILFIEDEDDHFEAAKEHLEPDFKCARSRALQVEAIAKEIEELKPVAIVHRSDAVHILQGGKSGCCGLPAIDLRA